MLADILRKVYVFASAPMDGEVRAFLILSYLGLVGYGLALLLDVPDKLRCGCWW